MEWRSYCDDVHLILKFIKIQGQKQKLWNNKQLDIKETNKMIRKFRNNFMYDKI